MQLYATTTSERASKGQGGNKFLAITICAENNYPLLFLNATVDGDEIKISIKDIDELRPSCFEKKWSIRAIDASRLKYENGKQKKDDERCKQPHCKNKATIGQLCSDCFPL